MWILEAVSNDITGIQGTAFLGELTVKSDIHNENSPIMVTVRAEEQASGYNELKKFEVSECFRVLEIWFSDSTD